MKSLSRNFCLLLLAVCFIFGLKGYGLESYQELNLIFRSLSQADKGLTDKIVSQAQTNYGWWKSPKVNKDSQDFKPEFLEIIDAETKKMLGKSLSDLARLSELDMRAGLGPEINRFVDAGRGGEINPLYEVYLQSNFNLVKEGKDLTVSNSNQRLWRREGSEVLSGESMGGNSGATAAVANFMVDRAGRFLFIGNIQSAPLAIRKLLDRGLLFQGGIRVAVDRTVWDIHFYQKFPEGLKSTVTGSFTEIFQTPPHLDRATFAKKCDEAWLKLLAPFRK